MELAPYLDTLHPELPGEVWGEHPRYSGYFVSTLGRIRGRSGKLLSQSTSRGYLRVAAVLDDGSRKDLRVHQAVLEVFVGPRPDPKMESSHMDGNETNNRSDNLKWCTKSENAQQRVAHGRTPPPGENYPGAKICTYAVNLVRSLCIDHGWPYNKVANISGMPAPTVAKIAQGRRRAFG